MINVKDLFDNETKRYFETEKFTLGPWTSESMINDPKHLAFVLSRYKFVAKVLEGRKKVLEVGCGDAFGAPLVAQSVDMLYAVDWEEIFIKDNAERLSCVNNIKFIQHDINQAPIDKNVKVNAIYSVDFIEHLEPSKEDTVMCNMIASYEDKESAIMMIGTPNLSASQYASPQSAALHINLKSHKTLRSLLEKYFYNVLMFGMNDEVLHTGYASMCHYLWGIGIGLR